MLFFTASKLNGQKKQTVLKCFVSQIKQDNMLARAYQFSQLSDVQPLADARHKFVEDLLAAFTQKNKKGKSSAQSQFWLVHY